MQREVTGAEFVSLLSDYVRKHEAALVSGKIKFAISPQNLRYLNSKFPKQYDGFLSPVDDFFRETTKKSRNDLIFIYKFMQKIEFLKINSPGRVKYPEAHIDVGHFQSLRYLELSKINVSSITQLSLLCNQIEILKVNYSISSFAELLSKPLEHPGDFDDQLDTPIEPPKHNSPTRHAWQALKELDCSHNSISKLDVTLRNLSNLEVFDASFNQIRKLQNLDEMTSLNQLNLGFNLISSVADVVTTIGNIKSLILRNNQLASVKGLEKIPSLEFLDLRENCIWDLFDINTLSDLPCLTILYLEGNPISLSESYRSQVFSFFTQRASPLRLDGTLPSFSESLLISATVKETQPERAIASPVVIQPIHAPKKGKKKKHNAIIGNIETDAVKKIVFEPIIEIDDSILRPERSDISVAEPEQKRLDSSESLGKALPASPRLPEKLKKRGLQRSSSMLLPRETKAESERVQRLPLPQRKYRNINSDDYKQRIEQLRTEGGSFWLRIYREMQGETAPPKRRYSLDLGSHDHETKSKAGMADEESPPPSSVPSQETMEPSYFSDDELPGSPVEDRDSGKVLSTSLPEKSWLASIFGFSTERGTAETLPKDLHSQRALADKKRSPAKPPPKEPDQNGEEEDDDDDFLLTCKVCQKPVKASKLSSHSLTCAVKTAEMSYRCFMCTKVFKIVKGRTFPICPNCQSAYVVDLADRKTSLGDLAFEKDEDEMDQPILQDNNILLFLSLKIFPNEDEKLVYFFRTSVVSSSSKEKPVYLVLSDMAVYILSLKPRSRPADVKADPEKFFKVVTSFELVNLVSLLVGPGKQTLTLHVNLTMLNMFESPSLVLILRDSIMCSSLVSKISVLCEKLPLESRTPLQIGNCRWVYDNIKRDVVLDENQDSFEGIASVKLFTLAYKADPQLGPTLKAPCTIILANEWIYLCEERFETYIEDNSKPTPQFVLLDSRPLSEIENLMLFKDAFNLSISFEQKKSLRDLNDYGNPQEGDEDFGLPVTIGTRESEETEVVRERPSSPTPSIFTLGSFRIDASFLQGDKPKRETLAPKMRRELVWELLFTNARERNLLRDCIATEWKELYKVDLFVVTQ